MNPHLELISQDEKDLLRNLMQAYRHDMSEYNGDEPDAMGSFGVGHYFDHYWVEPTRYPFKITANGSLAGFALVRQLQDGVYAMSEFFILRRHRGSGLGRKAAFSLFDRFRGTWHVAQDENNAPSQKFWRKVIGEYTQGVFEEQWSHRQPRGPKQLFRTNDETPSV